jgi:Integron Cassette Protein Hfx_Cass5
MKSDAIVAVELDGECKLHLFPATQEFPYMHLEGIEVHWDERRNSLYGPRPRQWSYAQWF